MQEDFSKTVWQYYEQYKRAMPWRNLEELSIKDRGYVVLVSEVMLQQTQVTRVIEKFMQWVEQWPTMDAFSNATLADVLVVWSGLGYNRRAKYLFDTLKCIQKDYNGVIPDDIAILQTMPGIGPNTAAAIIVYLYNKPLPFIETNIRTVYIHSFFANVDTVITDGQILSAVKDTLDADNPREWFYALMDYGAYLKKNQGSQLYRAKAYKKQTVFKDSNRYVRGRILRLLTQTNRISHNDLEIEIADDRLDDIIDALVSEGLIIRIHPSTYELPNR